jgi:hypothetical protein
MGPGGSALAGEVSAQEIVHALTAAPKPFSHDERVRARNPDPRDAAVRRCRDLFRLQLRRDHRAGEAAIGRTRALGSIQLKGAVVMLNGHADARAPRSTTKHCRSDAPVKRYLVDGFRLLAENLITAGYGKKLLKNAADPLAAENRRVQIATWPRPRKPNANPQRTGPSLFRMSHPRGGALTKWSTRIGGSDAEGSCDSRGTYKSGTERSCRAATPHRPRL